MRLPPSCRLVPVLVLAALLVACGGDAGSRCGGSAECDGTCIDTSSDPDHCGTCGRTCAADQECSYGSCQCPSGQLCSGACVDTRTDPDHCGWCGHSCGENQDCVAGRCENLCQPAGAACDTSSECCDGASCIQGRCGTCSDQRPQYCDGLGGLCWSEGVACSTAVECPDGSFLACFHASLDVDCEQRTCECPADYPVWCSPTDRLPGGCWTETTDCSSRVRCSDGELHACWAGMQYDCATGRCSCATGYRSCGGRCVDVWTDERNCGSCGRVCTTAETCVSGACEDIRPCPPGQTRCDGSCVNLDTDWGNCGACGLTCDSDPICTPAGCIFCSYRCQAGDCVQQSCNF